MSLFSSAVFVWLPVRMTLLQNWKGLFPTHRCMPRHVDGKAFARCAPCTRAYPRIPLALSVLRQSQAQAIPCAPRQRRSRSLHRRALGACPNWFGSRNLCSRYDSSAIRTNWPSRGDQSRAHALPSRFWWAFYRTYYVRLCLSCPQCSGWFL